MNRDIKKICFYVCKQEGLELEQLLNKTRKREIAQTRQMCMSLSKELTKNSLEVIGFNIGRKAHATVIHACKTIKNIRDTQPKFNEKYKEYEFYLKDNLGKFSITRETEKHLERQSFINVFHNTIEL